MFWLRSRRVNFQLRTGIYGPVPITEFILYVCFDLQEVYVEILTTILANTDLVPPDLVDSSAIPITGSIIREGPWYVQTIGLDKHIFERKIVNIFFLIRFNICFGRSKEPSH